VYLIALHSAHTTEFIATLVADKLIYN
jgi:hypothetical protein